MASLVAKSYCDAIFAIALEDHKQDQYKEQLLFVDKTMKDADFYTILSHPKIQRSEKKDVLEQVYGNCVDRVLLNFLKLLIDKGHFSSLHDIVKEYIKNYNEEHQIQVVNVRSATDLTKEETLRLTKALEEKLSKKVDLRLQVDKDLIAGMRIKIDDQIIDNSVSMKLQRLRKHTAITKI